MASDEVIPVLSGDDSQSEDEMLEAADNENEGGVGRERTPTLREQLASFRQQWQQELEKTTRQDQDQQAGSGTTRGKGQSRSVGTSSMEPLQAPSQRVAAQRADPERSRSSPTPVQRAGPERSRASPTPVQRAGPERARASPTPGQALGSEMMKDVDFPSLSETTEEKAKYLFRQGVHHERSGRMYEAVMFYKQAMHLVPDVESRVQESEAASRTGSGQVSDEDEEAAAGGRGDGALDILAGELQSLTTEDVRKTCHPKTPQTATHISVLPMEVLLYVLRWVVSSDLDLRSLEQVSMVCRGFYVCSRDSELWRKACCRMWGKMAYLLKDYSSWRHMYVERPHPHFNGIYISRVSYIRQGEPSMDLFYKPWHVVEYHRFLRVFSDGSVMLVTSVDDPQGVVSKMSKQSPITGKMTGHFRIVGDLLIASLENDSNTKEMDGGRRFIRHRQVPSAPDVEKTFHLELRISPYMHRPSMKLEWRNYSCCIRYRSTGNETVTDFDMNQQFSSFYFYRVKSYAKTSETPL